MNGIGKIIYQERERAGITQNELCAGICSVATLSRLEWTERNVGKWMIDMFLQRLGKSQDKFWTIVHIGDYELMELRRRIWDNILYGSFEEAEQDIQKYQNSVAMENLHEQFLKKCQGMIKRRRDCDRKGALQLFQEALKATVPDFELCKTEHILIGRDEMQIILLMAEEYYHSGREKTAWKLVRMLLKNIQRKDWDEEELVKIYPKVVKLYTDFLKKEDRYEEIMEGNYNKAKEILTSGIQSCMIAGRDETLARFLYCLGWVMKEEGSEENAKKARFIVKQAFYLADLLKLPNLSNEIRDYYEEEWEDKITY